MKKLFVIVMLLLAGAVHASVFNSKDVKPFRTIAGNFSFQASYMKTVMDEQAAAAGDWGNALAQKEETLSGLGQFFYDHDKNQLSILVLADNGEGEKHRFQLQIAGREIRLIDLNKNEAIVLDNFFGYARDKYNNLSDAEKQLYADNNALMEDFLNREFEHRQSKEEDVITEPGTHLGFPITIVRPKDPEVNMEAGIWNSFIPVYIKADNDGKKVDFKVTQMHVDRRILDRVFARPEGVNNSVKIEHVMAIALLNAYAPRIIDIHYKHIARPDFANIDAEYLPWPEEIGPVDKISPEMRDILDRMPIGMKDMMADGFNLGVEIMASFLKAMKQSGD